MPKNITFGVYYSTVVVEIFGPLNPQKVLFALKVRSENKIIYSTTRSEKIIIFLRFVEEQKKIAEGG